MYSIKIPKILFLALDIVSFYKQIYFNTNDLVELANKYKQRLVRQRSDKKDYKFLDDTNYGGLRGNFSTLLTWKGLVKRGNKIVSYYSIGHNTRLQNAITKGEIILNQNNLTANTENKKLFDLIKNELYLFKMKEGQAHIKAMLEKNPSLPLKRDHHNFPKDSIVITPNDQYFIRGMINNKIDKNILEFNIINLWNGLKIKKKNLHILISVPKKDNPWGELFFIKNEDLFKKMPILLNIDLDNKKCADREGNFYRLYTINEALKEFSKGYDNISARLQYKWDDLKNRESQCETDFRERKKDEFIIFLNKFLKWTKEFEINGKKVIDIESLSTGGPDINLIYSGGTKQKLELEHNWKNYLDHKHHENNAWANTWIFAEEEWNENLIIKLFGDQKQKNGDRIPDVFLCLDKGKRRVYKAEWENKKFKEIDIKF